MRTLVLFALSLTPAAAQSPLVRLVNLSHFFSGKFQIGDRFEIQITGAPHQPVSVRTVREGHIDWGPVLGSTDDTGRWSTAGQFEKADFGDWSEIWTVGGKLGSSAIRFDVDAPCLPGGVAFRSVFGLVMSLTCDTADGSQTFSTPSSDGFRTPDGRSIVVNPTQQTPEEYHMETLSNWITSPESGDNRIALSSSKGGLGDETADLISKLIGVNALNEKETQNVLAAIRYAFEKPETISPDARQPPRTLLFLQHLREVTGQESLRRQIAETIAYLQSR
jgi:hypothetical protein